MELLKPGYSRFICFVGALSLLPIKAETNFTENSTLAKQGNTRAHTEPSIVLPSKDNTSQKSFLGNETMTTSETKSVPFSSNSSNTTAGYKWITINLKSSTLSTTIGAQQRTSSSNSTLPVPISDYCKEFHRSTFMIFIIIIAALVLLCTFFLISTVVLANQVSNLKTAAQSKRQTRNNGDFLTISSSLWPGGSDKWKNSQLLTGPNLSMEDLSIDGDTNPRRQKSKEGTTEKIKESCGKSKDEKEPKETTSLRGHDDNMGQTLSEDLKSNI